MNNFSGIVRPVLQWNEAKRQPEQELKCNSLRKPQREYIGQHINIVTFTLGRKLKGKSIKYNQFIYVPQLVYLFEMDPKHIGFELDSRAKP